MSVETVLTRCLNLAHPVFQAPLAGRGDTLDLVAAISNAGALGFIGAAYLTPQLIPYGQTWSAAFHSYRKWWTQSGYQ